MSKQKKTNLKHQKEPTLKDPKKYIPRLDFQRDRRRREPKAKFPPFSFTKDGEYMAQLTKHSTIK